MSLSFCILTLLKLVDQWKLPLENNQAHGSHNRRYGAPRRSSHLGASSAINARRMISQVKTNIQSNRTNSQTFQAEQSFLGVEETVSNSDLKSLQEQLNVVLVFLERLVGTKLSISEMEKMNQEAEMDQAESKVEENQHETNPADENYCKIPFVGDSINPAEEKAFSAFKLEFYNSQLTGLTNLENQWLSINDNSDHAQNQLNQIKEQKKQTEETISFWVEQKNFWNDIGKAGHSKENRSEINYLLSQLTGLENLMDQWASVQDDTGFTSSQRTKIRSQVDSIKGQIKDLHSSF
jgi:hypothetical protein